MLDKIFKATKSVTKNAKWELVLRVKSYVLKNIRQVREYEITNKYKCLVNTRLWVQSPVPNKYVNKYNHPKYSFILIKINIHKTSN